MKHLSCRKLRLVFLAFLFTVGGSLQAQTYEDKFQDIFITAGYATAFGAALGAASLGLSTNPEKNLDYIAIGASLGFIGGAVMGMFIVFQPVMISDSEKNHDHLAYVMEPRKIYLRPEIDRQTGGVSGIAGAWTLSTF